MSARGARIEARERAVRLALALALAERSAGANGMPAVKRADDAFELACRELVDAVNDAPPVERPKGWTVSAEGATA